MKKIISIMLCVLIILFCPIYAYAQTEEIISEIDIEHEMTSAEIDEFLLTARPISDLVSSEDKPIEEKIDYSLDRNGSYKYDAKTQQVTFESAENINLYNARAEEKTESISFGVDSEYFPKNINVSEEIGGISTFGIIGDDNRTRVKDTTKGPWCNTVRLLMKINGNNYVGSGFMIGPNSVATAGHCVYSKSNGWASSITVIPAVNGTSKPYGTATMTSMECGGNWYKDENNQDDWGIIRVNKNIGKSTGWLGLRWQSASYNNQYLYANGYPAEYPNYMYYGYGKVTSCSARTIVGNWDLSGGQSGGPVFKYIADYGYCAVGINRGGSSTYSDCLRIDEWIFNKFMSYRTKTA